MDPDRLPEVPGLTVQDIEDLTEAGLVRLPPPATQPKERIDYYELQQAYGRMLAEVPFASQTELARHTSGSARAG